MNAPVEGVPVRDVQVVVADDQVEVRDGLVGLLGLLPGVAVAGVAGDGEAAVALVVRGGVDVVLMDLRMPRMDGVEATRRVVASTASARVVVLTTYRDDESITAALAAGARGYLTKDSTADEIAHAIALVHAGGFVLGRDVTAPVGRRRIVQPPTPLTAREEEVLRLIAAGRSNAEVAAQLVVSAATVKTHINNLFAKLGVRDRAQAVVWAFESGLVPPPS